MGVKTEISLEELDKIFPNYDFKILTPTSDGVIDTTYIVDNLILKRYERDIKDKIQNDMTLLKTLQYQGLNVPTLIDSSKGWYLYEKLQGESIKNVNLSHIQELARFLAKLHSLTYKKSCYSFFLDSYDVDSILKYIKHNFFFYYKKFEFFKYYKMKNDGFIHGDIFKDNTLFKDDKIAVFDFIDGGCGSFVFDIAVCLTSFNSHKKISFTKQFLQTYNQKAPRKITLKEVEIEIEIAIKFYDMLRIYR